VRYLKGGTGDSDLSLFRRAITQGWPVTEERRQEIIEKLMEILATGTHKDAVNAARILEAAAANDKRYEIEVLKILQSDQVEQERTAPARLDIDGHVQREVDQMTTEDIHRLLESGS
jgi:hypothetical protein